MIFRNKEQSYKTTDFSSSPSSACWMGFFYEKLLLRGLYASFWSVVLSVFPWIPLGRNIGYYSTVNVLYMNLMPGMT